MTDTTFSSPLQAQNSASFPKSLPVRLLEKRVWRRGLVSLRFQKPDGFSFTPGQFVKLGLDLPQSEGGSLRRAYSPVSLPEDPYIEFFIVEVPGGALSGRLVAMHPGEDAILETELWGSLLPSRLSASETLWCLSSGTGVAPFIGILREPQTWQKWPHAVLVHSVRFAEDLAYTREISEIQASSALGGAPGRSLKYVPVVTREATQFLSGRIPDLIAEGLLEDEAQAKLEPETSRVMLCGNPKMIEAVRAQLKPLGFKAPRRTAPGNLLSENLWQN